MGELEQRTHIEEVHGADDEQGSPEITATLHSLSGLLIERGVHPPVEVWDRLLNPEVRGRYRSPVQRMDDAMWALQRILLDACLVTEEEWQARVDACYVRMECS